MKILTLLLLLFLPLCAFGGNGDIDKLADTQQKSVVANKTSVLAKRFADLTYTPVKGQLFIDGVSANDIKHGYAGNTMVTATLASAAEQNPKLISELISVHDDGTYTVHFKGLGDISVDGKLPTFKGSPVFTHTPNGELWAAIIEKAYAQVKDAGYEATTDLNKRVALPERREVMSDIFGSRMKAYNGTKYDLSRVSKVTSIMLLKSFHSGMPSVAVAGGGMYSKIGSDQVYDYGLAPGHTYAVIDVKKQKKGQIKVRLYNPWGRIEPGIGVGADKKTTTAKKATAADGRNDGAFWISWSEFNAYFDWVTGPVYEAPLPAELANKAPVLDSKSDAQTSSPLSLKLTPKATKRFAFTWNDAPDETHYKLFEKPNKDSKFTEIAKLTANSTSYTHSVPLHKRMSAQYILEACNDAGCTPSTAVSVTDTWADAIGYIKASNTDKKDFFGAITTLSDDGNTLAVAAAGEDSFAKGINGNENDNSASDSGAVYVFSRHHNQWVQQAYIKASNAEAGDFFGHSIALSTNGKTLAVSAPAEDGGGKGIGVDGTDNSVAKSGAVYVFSLGRNNKWSQQAYIKASNTDKEDLFGGNIALSDDGNTLAVGALKEDSNAKGIKGNENDNSASNSGAVYVFSRHRNQWAQQAYIKASNVEAGDVFGSLALSGDGETLAVSATGEDSSGKGIGIDWADNSAAKSGAVYVFSLSRNNKWSQQTYIKASNTDKEDFFGTDIALSADGNTLAVTARGEDSSARGINGNQTDNSASNSGAAYVYTRRLGDWAQQAYIKASNTEASDNFGLTIALSADGYTMAVGATWEDSNANRINRDGMNDSKDFAGAAYVYTRSDGIWSQQAYIKASNTDTADFFGSSIALSMNGNTLAIGAIGEDSNAMGIEGDETDNSASAAGAVYIYTRRGSD